MPRPMTTDATDNLFNNNKKKTSRLNNIINNYVRL